MIKGTQSGRPSTAGVREAIACITLGIRDSLTLRSIAFSLSLWVAAVGLWGILFVIFREELSRFAIGAVSVMMHGLAAQFSNLVNSTSGATGGGIGKSVADVSSLALGWLLVALTYIIFVLLTVRVLAELLLMSQIRKQVLKKYPDLSVSPPAGSGKFNRVSFGNWARPWSALIILSPLCLLLPVVGGILLFVLLSYLNVRFLVNDAADELVSPEEVRTLVREQRMELMILGMLCTLLNFVPLIGLLIPWTTGSAVCHLTMRRLIESRIPAAAGSL